MTSSPTKRYKHETAVLDGGFLQARCIERSEDQPHWTGTPQDQARDGVARAHANAVAELNEHVRKTGHVAFKHRHGGPR